MHTCTFSACRIAHSSAAAAASLSAAAAVSLSAAATISLCAAAAASLSTAASSRISGMVLVLWDADPARGETEARKGWHVLNPDKWNADHAPRSWHLSWRYHPDELAKLAAAKGAAGKK